MLNTPSPFIQKFVESTLQQHLDSFDQDEDRSYYETKIRTILLELVEEIAGEVEKLRITEAPFDITLQEYNDNFTKILHLLRGEETKTNTDKASLSPEETPIEGENKETKK